jgi:hypothetical protein
MAILIDKKTKKVLTLLPLVCIMTVKAKLKACSYTDLTETN